MKIARSLPSTATQQQNEGAQIPPRKKTEISLKSFSPIIVFHNQSLFVVIIDNIRLTLYLHIQVSAACESVRMQETVQSRGTLFLASSVFETKTKTIIAMNCIDVDVPFYCNNLQLFQITVSTS